MDLSNPLSSLIPSLDAAALEVLAGTESALGASRIHQLSGRGSRQGIVNALNRLVEHGIVAAEPTNYGSVYRLNREHVLAPAVLLAADARRTLIQRLAEACDRLSPRPLSAYLFGSVARNDANPRSDIDLLLVTDEETLTDVDGWPDQLYQLAEQVRRWTGNRLGVLAHSPGHLADLVRSHEPIVDSWRDDAITLFGPDIRTILAQTQHRSEDQ